MKEEVEEEGGGKEIVVCDAPCLLLAGSMRRSFLADRLPFPLAFAT